MEIRKSLILALSLFLGTVLINIHVLGMEMHDLKPDSREVLVVLKKAEDKDKLFAFGHQNNHKLWEAKFGAGKAFLFNIPNDNRANATVEQYKGLAYVFYAMKFSANPEQSFVMDFCEKRNYQN